MRIECITCYECEKRYALDENRCYTGVKREWVRASYSLTGELIDKEKKPKRYVYAIDCPYCGVQRTLKYI